MLKKQKKILKNFSTIKLIIIIIIIFFIIIFSFQNKNFLSNNKSNSALSTIPTSQTNYQKQNEYLVFENITVEMPSNTVPEGSIIKVEKVSFEKNEDANVRIESILPSFLLSVKTNNNEIINKFLSPIQITYNYSAADLTNIKKDSIQLFKINEETRQFEPLNTTSFNLEAKKITASTSNTGRYAIMGIVKDRISPITSVFINGSQKLNNTYSVPVTIELIAEDQSEDDISGILNTFYSINYTEEDNNWIDYEGKFELNNKGNYTFIYFSSDNAGNKEQLKTIRFTIN